MNRKVTEREYKKVLDHALEIGVENGFWQTGDTAKESFIPVSYTHLRERAVKKS